ncbi:uncharacterized protein [Watersipora subatra]|uniref:uncharacterized protein n=1 Tax=Watersipora subatra TaxID=2589382 RepID=UPI00355B626E
MIANISLEEIQEEEKRMRDEQIAFEQQELEKQVLKKDELIQLEGNTKKRLAKDNKEKRRQLARLVEIARRKEKLQVDLLHLSFERAESQLQNVLRNRKFEVKRMFGDLVSAESDYGGSGGRRCKLDWDRTHQPVEIKLSSLRGVRNKLPAGRYVMIVSLYNRLGGHVMQWSQVDGQQWGGATLPVIHEGKFYNSEIKINQRLFTVLPSKPSIRPGMIITFELYLLKGSLLNRDRVVAWGCFPICDGTFEVVEGKYKAPMLRGEMDMKLEKHSQIEEIIASDLDHWLCNTYFEIIRLPRYIDGQKEYEVELKFSSALVNHPDRVNMDGEEYKDSENPILGSVAGSQLEVTTAGSASEVTSVGQPATNKTSSLGSWDKRFGEDEDTEDSRSSKELREGGAYTDNRHVVKGDATSVHSDHALEAGDSDSSFDEEDIFVLRKGKDEYEPADDNLGLYFKRHLNNPVDIYTKKLYSSLPKANKSKKKQKQKKSYAEELQEHTVSVKSSFSEKGHIVERGWKRVSYLSRMFMAELGLSQWRSREFWAMLILFVFTFFLRMYLHYTGQFLYLTWMSIPINSFNFLPYTVHLNYQSTLLHVLEEMFVVLVGPMTVFLLFAICVTLAWICQKIMGTFPDIGCKFVLMFGLQSFFNPILLIIVDAAQQTYDYNNLSTSLPLADFAKMYWYFMRTQGTGLGGAFVTVFLYFFIMFLTASVLYMYFLRLHNNGRMLDIYWRLHSQTEQMFMPYDLEVSLQEFDYIRLKAEQWRGEDGARRKVAVYDYIWEEEDKELAAFDQVVEVTKKQEKKKEKTSHIAIHTLHTDGLRELYRHFLVLPDGAIVEVLFKCDAHI